MEEDLRKLLEEKENTWKTWMIHMIASRSFCIELEKELDKEKTVEEQRQEEGGASTVTPQKGPL